MWDVAGEVERRVWQACDPLLGKGWRWDCADLQRVHRMDGAVSKVPEKTPRFYHFCYHARSKA